MDIVFQSGEFIEQGGANILETLVGAFIGTGTALGLFLFEGRRQRKTEREKKENDLRDFLFYFCLLLKGIKATLEKQIPEYKEHSTKLKEEPFNFHLLNQNINEDLERISTKLDLERLFHAYILVNGSDDISKKEYKNLISLIDHTYLVYKQSLESQRLHFEQLTKYLREYKDLVEEQTINKSTYIANQILINNPETYAENPFYIALNTTILNYYQQQPEPLTFEYMQLNLVQPLKHALFPNFRHIEEGILLSDNCRKATWLYNEIINKSKLTASEFKSYAEQFEENLEKLKQIKGCS